MALTAAERKKKFIDKLKTTGKYDDYKKKRAADERHKQQRIKNGLELMPKAVREKTKRLKRDYNRKKAAKYRLRKRNEKIGAPSPKKEHSPPSETVTTNSIEPYKTASAVSKAVAKLKRALPSSPAKKKVVLKKLLQSLDESDSSQIVGEAISSNNGKKSRGLKSDTVDAIKAFYERDDISRISPNMRDSRKFVDPASGVKEIRQLRYLMYKLSDVHRMFEQNMQKGNNCVQPVGLSKFSSLRPAHVKLVGATPLDQCLCHYHTNFIMCCKAINVHLSQFPSYGSQLELLLLCNGPKKECWFRSCKKCPDAKNVLFGILKESGKSQKTAATLCQWSKNNETNRFQKHVESGTLGTLIAHFLKILPEFLRHSYIKRQQSLQFQNDDKKSRESNGRIASLQIDFAEGFNCEAQDEIQSAHWNQATISLFTACMKCDEHILPKVISSDSTSHTKFEIACYLYKIVSKLPTTVKTLILWSDGPNNQFKNRFTAAIIKLLQDSLKVKIYWNFFAAAHGKGSVDGIGAVVKNRVKRLVKSRHSIVNCSQDFCQAFNSEESVVEVMHMSEVEGKKIRQNLMLDDVFAAAPAVPNVFNCHQMQIIDGKVKVFVTSEEGYNYFIKNCL